MNASNRVDRVIVTPDVVYGHRHEVPLSFDLYRPVAANGAAVLFINSGGFVSGRLVQYAESGQVGVRFLKPGELTVPGAEPPIPLLEQFSFAGLLARGFTVFDIRHSNHPPALLDEMVEDVHNAARFVREHAAEYGIDPSRIGLWGASAGGYLALHVGLSSVVEPFASIATYYPAGYDFVADVERFPELAGALPMLKLEKGRLDALGLKHRVHDAAPPILIVYGANDMPFIIDPCEALCADLQESAGGIRCLELPGTGHEFSGEDGYHAEQGARAYAEMIDWFVTHLDGS